MYHIKTYWQNIFNYRDKTSRREYWMQVLMNTIAWIVAFVILTFVIGIILGLVLNNVTDDTVTGASMTAIVILGIANLLPTISLTVRRVRDAVDNPWLTFFYVIPVAGPVIIFVFTLLPSSEKK
jgi:uncharacterized membrane protein YhaH (DUF805 family)